LSRAGGSVVFVVIDGEMLTTVSVGSALRSRISQDF